MCTISIQFYVISATLSFLMLYVGIILEIILYGVNIFSLFTGASILLIIARTLTFIGEIGMIYFVVAQLQDNINSYNKASYLTAFYIAAASVMAILISSCVSFFVIKSTSHQIVIEKNTVLGFVIPNALNFIFALVGELLMLCNIKSTTAISHFSYEQVYNKKLQKIVIE